MELKARKENRVTSRTVNVDEKEVALRRRTSIWFSIQRIYMPCVDALRPVPSGEGDEGGDEEDAGCYAMSVSDLELNLPESLTPDTRSQLPTKLLTKYRRLRLAQAEDALNSMKRHLRKGATLFKHKKDQTAGTGVAANTRMQVAIARQEAKKRLDADRYRNARNALLVLCPLGKWKQRLLPLRESDIRPLAAEGTVGEGRRVLTWIWRMRPAAEEELEPGDDEDINDDGENEELLHGNTATDELEGTHQPPFPFKVLFSSHIMLHSTELRAEWAKSLARAERWEEEVQLLKMEMVRSLNFFECKSISWLATAHERTDMSSDIRAGVFAYAHKQSHLCKQMAKKYATHWLDIFRFNKLKLPRSWPVAYRVTAPSSTQIQRRRHRQQAHIRLVKESATMEVDET